MKILVLNSGSSSIKYQLFGMADRAVLASGRSERIGEPSSITTHRLRRPDGTVAETVDTARVADHEEALRAVVATLAAEGLNDVAGVGHRVVHGGEAFREPTLVTDEVLAGIRKQIPLAPLHNPANVRGIEVARELLPDLPQVAVFDTAFHRTLPPRAFRYAVPSEFYAEHGVRRYGFHGTSHEYVARTAAAHLDVPPQRCNLITLHLGNGASVTAVENGRSVDTSMGLSPLEGLVMGTRCGDLDPAVIFHLARVSGLSADQVETALNHDSGLRGLCGENDMRLIEQRREEGDEAAALAFEAYCYRVRKYIGAYMAVLGRVDALVFTAGIGQHSAAVRAHACRGLEPLGVVVDPERNRAALGHELAGVHAQDSPVGVLVVPTNEELEIAEQTGRQVVAARPQP